MAAPLRAVSAGALLVLCLAWPCVQWGCGWPLIIWFIQRGLGVVPEHDRCLVNAGEYGQPLVQTGDPQDLHHQRLRRDEAITAPGSVGVIGDPDQRLSPQASQKDTPATSSSSTRAWPPMAA